MTCDFNAKNMYADDGWIIIMFMEKTWNYYHRTNGKLHARKSIVCSMPAVEASTRNNHSEFAQNPTFHWRECRRRSDVVNRRNANAFVDGHHR